METELSPDALLENSTRSLLQTMAEEEPVLFLKLLKKKRDPDRALDDKTVERFVRMGIMNERGDIHEPVKKALQRVRFDEDVSMAELFDEDPRS